MARIYLQRVRLDSGGYDRRGRYFGVGVPLYKWSTEFEGKDRDGHVRGKSRAEAMSEVRRELVRYSKWPHSSQGPFGSPPKAHREGSRQALRSQKQFQKIIGHQLRRGECGPALASLVQLAFDVGRYRAHRSSYGRGKRPAGRAPRTLDVLHARYARACVIDRKDRR